MKKIALISDIHGNLPALNAVVNDIENNSVDSIVCLGDVATLGPSPREVLDVIRNLKCLCVLGNHDEAVLAPEKSGDFNINGSMLQDTIYWCLEKLEDEDVLFLKEFKPSLSIPLINGSSMLCYHGSPQSSIDSILPDSSDDDIKHYINMDNSVKIAVGGHTHFQMCRKYKEVLVVNTGSVGCSFVNPSYSPLAPSLSSVAEYAIVEYDDKNISVSLKSINYDFEKFKLMVMDSDIPLKKWWLEEFKRLEVM